MKSMVLWIGVVATIACFGCSVEAEIDTPACEAVACADALIGGLDVQGDALCSASADAAYGDVFACGCGDSGGPGACEQECGDNLCVDAGESPDCGDCLNQLCQAEHDICGNN